MKQKVQLEFGPCNCLAYSQAVHPEDYGHVEGDPAAHYDTLRSAARGFINALQEGRKPRVHWNGRHVVAVWVDGVRYPPQELVAC